MRNTEIGCFFWYLCPDMRSPQDLPWPVFPSHHYGKMAAQHHLCWHHDQHPLRHHLLRNMYFWMRRSIEIPSPPNLKSMHLGQECCHSCLICVYCAQRCHGLDHGSSTHKHHLAPQHAKDDKVLGIPFDAAGGCWKHCFTDSLCFRQESGTERHVL